MTGPTTVTAFVTKATGFIARALFLALPLVVAQARETDSPRTIDVKLSRYAFSPERIEVGRADAERGRHVHHQVLRVLRTRSWPHEGLVDRDAWRVNAD
jgi:predicted transcriptional regulator